MYIHTSTCIYIRLKGILMVGEESVSYFSHGYIIFKIFLTRLNVNKKKSYYNNKNKQRRSEF